MTTTSSNPCCAEQLEDVLHARLADDRHHRLRLVRGERPQPRSLAARHHDGLHANASRFAFSDVLRERRRTRARGRPRRSTSGHVVPSRVTITKPSDSIQEPRRGLAEQVDPELVAAAHHDRRADERDDVARGDQQREPRQTPGVDAAGSPRSRSSAGRRAGRRSSRTPTRRASAARGSRRPGRSPPRRRRRSPPATTGRRRTVVISHT